jgi:hypothetical protein
MAAGSVGQKMVLKIRHTGHDQPYGSSSLTQPSTAAPSRLPGTANYSSDRKKFSGRRRVTLVDLIVVIISVIYLYKEYV